MTIARDKVIHFAGCFGLTLAIGLVGVSLRIAALPALALGVAKEAWDSTAESGWSWGDMLADVLGAAVALAVLAGLRWIP